MSCSRSYIELESFFQICQLRELSFFTGRGAICLWARIFWGSKRGTKIFSTASCRGKKSSTASCRGKKNSTWILCPGPPPQIINGPPLKSPYCKLTGTQFFTRYLIQQWQIHMEVDGLMMLGGLSTDLDCGSQARGLLGRHLDALLGKALRLLEM